MKTSNPLKRNKYSKNRPSFFTSMIPGDGFKDVVSGVNAVCSISGTRYGIVNGVVTQFAVNQVPIEDDGLRGCTAFTNTFTYNSDMTSALLVRATATANAAISPNGTMTASKVIPSIDNNNHRFDKISTTSLVVGDVYTQSIFAKAGEYNCVQFAIGEAVVQNNYVSFNLSTGAKTVVGNVIDSRMIAFPNGWYLCSLTAAAGPTNRNVFGVGNNNIYSFAGDTVSGIYVWGTQLTKTYELMPPIPTAGVAVSVVSEAATATTGTSFDLDLATLSRLKTGLRGPNAQGHIELELESNVDSGWLANSSGFNVMSVNNQQYANGALFFYKNSSGGLTFNLRDGLPNDCIISSMPTFTVGQTFKIFIDYGTYTDGSQKMRLTVNGVRSSVVAFSGSFGAQDLRFFFGNTVHAGWIKNLKYYEKPRW